MERRNLRKEGIVVVPVGRLFSVGLIKPPRPSSLKAFSELLNAVELPKMEPKLCKSD